MTSGAISPRCSAYDDASRSAMDAAANAADYLGRMRALRNREAVALVRAELRRRVPARARGGRPGAAAVRGAGRGVLGDGPDRVLGGPVQLAC